MSAFLSDVAREVTQAAGEHWLPGSMALVVLATALALLVQREAARGVLTAEREQRARATSVVVVPLLLCGVLVVGARLLEAVT
jgi:hypothetical protein